MNETISNWDDLRLFLAVARHGGLAGAATATGKSAPTLARRMLALERALGRDLFHRMPRGYALTEGGSALVNELGAVEAGIDAVQTENRAVVKISAGAWMTHILCQNVGKLVQGEPGIALRFLAADHVLDILHREAVIGIRNQRPDQPGLACRRIGAVDFAVYGAGEVWAQVLGQTPSARWVAAQSGPMIEVSHPRNALDLAQAGTARAVLPTCIGDAREGLPRLSPAIPELTHDQWLVTHHEDRFLPEVRRVIDSVYTILRALHRA